MDYDVMVVGSGIGGMESALKLGDMGYKVLLVEKEASVGGKMILLSKVFPTLDCASCISTPRMAATVHHPNIRVLTYSEVKEIKRDPKGRFKARVVRHPTFVNESVCTGCRQCEMACSVAVPDQFNSDLVSRRAAYIAFPQAVPKKAVIEREGTSPCAFNCPAGIRSHGYVALARSRKFEEAFNLVLENTPLVGTLGRTCFAPCETECTRGSLEGPVSIRRIKRFIADRYYDNHPETKVKEIPANGKKVAVVGSGPAGLTAAWHLALKGHRVTIFESEDKPGGMLRYAIPQYRLPKSVVDRDIRNLTGIGIEMVTGTRVEVLSELRNQGFEAVLVAVGTHRPLKLGVEGENLPGVYKALDFLASVNRGQSPDLKDKKVVVVGGGNVAVDAARCAMRLGAQEVRQVCLEKREQMPAHAWEVEEAMAEGIILLPSLGVSRILGKDAVQELQLKTCSAVFGNDGRFSPKYDQCEVTALTADIVIVAIGMIPETAAFAGTLKLNKNGTMAVDPLTMQTGIPYIFAAGDVVTGPSMITSACGQGQRAALMIDRWIMGESLQIAGSEEQLPMAGRDRVLARQKKYRLMAPVSGQKNIVFRPDSFDELEAPLSTEDAAYSTGRCLDCGVCSECRQCSATCPACAVDMSMRPVEEEAEVASVIVSTGYRLFPAELKPQYGYGRYSNVVTGMQLDRLLAPTRPYNTVLRPGDGKAPEKIAYILCAGSRDQSVGNPMCSRFCCMYSIKQNQLIMGVLPLADVTVYYVDIRAFSKGYDEFYEQARSMGASFIKGRVARIQEKDNGDLTLHYEDIDNGGILASADHDLVVLSVGVMPNSEAEAMFQPGELAVDAAGFVLEVDEDLHPGRTCIEGVYVAGSASGARDIPDSILHAGAAAVQAAAHVERVRTTP